MSGCHIMGGYERGVRNGGEPVNLENQRKVLI